MERWRTVLLDMVRVEIARARASNATPRLATVTGTAPLAIRFWGDDIATTNAVGRLASYSPAAGDTVQVQQVGARWVVQGKVV